MDATSVQSLQSRAWSCGTLMEGVAAILHDAEIELPESLDQLEESSTIYDM